MYFLSLSIYPSIHLPRNRYILKIKRHLKDHKSIHFKEEEIEAQWLEFSFLESFSSWLGFHSYPPSPMPLVSLTEIFWVLSLLRDQLCLKLKANTARLLGVALSSCFPFQHFSPLVFKCVGLLFEVLQSKSISRRSSNGCNFQGICSQAAGTQLVSSAAQA